MTGSDGYPSFTLAYVPGVTPGKWVRTWNNRLPEVPLTLIQVSAAEAAGVVRDRDADAALLRLPTDRTGLHAIPLYTETTVVVVPKDHLVATAEEVCADDLADDIVLQPRDDTLDWEQPPGRPAIERPATTADAIELVAAGVGLLVVPQSLARLHHRKDLAYRPVTDVQQSRVALSWLEEETTDLMEQFIGIVRGRTVNSTRGRQPASPPAKRKRPAGDGNKAAVRKSAGGNRRLGSGTPNSRKRGKPRRRS
ncbi:LysR family substrate-binding domain-containing protein [Saccharopolyspora phatthalungensis]|uniref:DNA-binding transcriptional LysR family regulator n=1 Tax=Saccharopolyspora phatthalungensis TaxID=664693 RepID=A0A840QI58_9PSEU|nr:LysR family substrate-binding domain-containing protein [Saccharopolyspora phatthalungensis]MBB5159951.1 DNA-binding transcriptional LysR family regulator [Saccharopolyspora phatthalungensis]